jgi:hypothetical protein
MQTSKDALPPTLWRWRGWWRPVRFLEKEHTAMNDNEVLCSVKDLRVERIYGCIWMVNQPTRNGGFIWFYGKIMGRYGLPSGKQT